MAYSLTLVLRDIEGSNETLKGAALAAGCSRAKNIRTTPISTIEAVAWLNGEVILPDGLGVLYQECLVGRVRLALVQLLEVSSKDTLELEIIAAAVVWQIAAVGKNAVAVDQMSHGGIGNDTGGCEVRWVSRGDIEICETADNNPLVVGPGWLVVVIHTGVAVDSIVDKALAVDESDLLEPGPNCLGGTQVRLLLAAGDSVGETSADGKVQLYYSKLASYIFPLSAARWRKNLPLGIASGLSVLTSPLNQGRPPQLRLPQPAFISCQMAMDSVR